MALCACGCVCVRACASLQHGKQTWLSTKDSGSKAWWDHGKTPGHNAIQSPLQVRAHARWRPCASHTAASDRPSRAGPPRSRVALARIRPDTHGRLFLRAGRSGPEAGARLGLPPADHQARRGCGPPVPHVRHRRRYVSAVYSAGVGVAGCGHTREAVERVCTRFAVGQCTRTGGSLGSLLFWEPSLPNVCRGTVWNLSLRGMVQGCWGRKLAR